ncbi:MAG: hypothetical protein OXI46_00080 [Gemmatimonadota bacterium]|nr:hypothetical protein [Gemmatimonadota bacterium]
MHDLATANSLLIGRIDEPDPQTYGLDRELRASERQDEGDGATDDVPRNPPDHGHEALLAKSASAEPSPRRQA